MLTKMGAENKCEYTNYDIEIFKTICNGFALAENKSMKSKGK